MENLQNPLKTFCKEETIQFLSRLVENPKSDERILEWAGFLALENEQWMMAENIFSSLLERREKALDLVGLAQALKRQSRLEESEECYLEALNHLKEPCSLLFIVQKALGDIYLLKGDFPMAEEYYNKASTLNPQSPSLLFHRAMMHLKEKNYSLAEKHFQTFVKDHLSSAKAWLGLSLVRKALGDEELAQACLKRCLDLEPENAQALKLQKDWAPSLFETFSTSFDFSV